jgi:hypothetical protein
MEKFLEAAAIAWNPVGEVRKRITAGTLTVSSVLVPFIGIVIACNLFAIGAQNFFWQSVLHVAGGELPNYPLMNSDYAQRLLSAAGVLVPVAAASFLPSKMFYPHGRSATAAAMLVVAASWAFYGAAISVPVNFINGVLVTSDLESTIKTYIVCSVLTGIGIISVTVFFWFRIMFSVLKLSAARIADISLVVLVTATLLVGFFLSVALSTQSRVD